MHRTCVHEFSPTRRPSRSSACRSAAPRILAIWSHASAEGKGPDTRRWSVRGHDFSNFLYFFVWNPESGAAVCKNLHRGFDSRRRLSSEQFARFEDHRQWFARPLSFDQLGLLGFHWRWRGHGRSPPAKGRGLWDRGLLAAIHARRDAITSAP